MSRYYRAFKNIVMTGSPDNPIGEYLRSPLQFPYDPTLTAALPR
jgi:hypothetical protein